VFHLGDRVSYLNSQHTLNYGTVMWADEHEVGVRVGFTSAGLGEDGYRSRPVIVTFATRDLRLDNM